MDRLRVKRHSRSVPTCQPCAEWRTPPLRHFTVAAYIEPAPRACALLAIAQGIPADGLGLSGRGPIARSPTR